MNDPLSFLSGGGEAERMIRARDWSSHPMGPPDRWPDTFKTMLSMLLNSPESLILAWGPELSFFFNEAYFPLLGPRLPWAMGERFDKVWADGWDQAKPIIDEAMAGRSKRFVDLPWKLGTDRGAADTWWTFSYSRVLDSHGEIAGLLIVTNETTARVVADRRAKFVEDQLLRAQRAGGVGLFSVDIATDQLQPTPEFCRLYGLPVQDSYPAATIEARIVPEDRHLVSTATSRARGEPIHDVEFRIRRRDTGEVRWINRKGEVERDQAERPVRFSGVARDVTAQREAVAALAANEERFRTIIETIDAAFAIVRVKFDPDDRPVDYRFIEANPAFERQTGVDLHGKWVTEFAPNLEQFWFDTYGHVAKTGEPATFERYAEAFERWFDVRAVRVGDPAERQIAIFFSDVTARREAEQRLRASEALARENIERVQLALAAGAIIGTWFWDITADRFTVDEAFARAFGLDPALGRDGIPLAQIVATVHPDDQAGLAAAISKAIARGGSYAHQYRTRRADGHYYWLEANGQVNLAPDGTASTFPGVLIDVEERRAVEAERDRVTAELRALTETLEQRVAARSEELLRSEEALRQSQKMEAVGQLTGGLAHDFNNLLAVITGSLELLEMRIAKGRINDIERYITASRTAAKRATSLTHRLLAFSRRQTLDPQRIDVNTLVAGMADMIRRSVGPEITLEIIGTADLWMTLVDPSQLENALLNLCINARDAMPDGGRIMVETSNKVFDDHASRFRDMVPGDYITLSVTDTGSGMPPEVVARVFEPFYTTKPMGQGTGLGLSMVYGFARQSEGQVRIHSEVGKGTTVNVYLPRSVGAVGRPEAVQAEMLVRAEAGQTVLVVDDEQNVRMLIVDVLEELGYTAIEAHDGQAGLKVLRSDLRIDLLVTDVGMPGMNGRQLADAGRVQRPGLKVLFVTGYAETAVISHGHLEQGMAVVTKPFALDALASRIKTMIEGPNSEV